MNRAKYRVLWLVNKGVSRKDILEVMQRASLWLLSKSSSSIDYFLTVNEVDIDVSGPKQAYAQSVQHPGSAWYSLRPDILDSIDTKGYEEVVFFYDRTGMRPLPISCTYAWKGRPISQITCYKDFSPAYSSQVEQIWWDTHFESIHRLTTNLNLKGIYTTDNLEQNDFAKGFDYAENISIRSIVPYWQNLVEPLPVDYTIMGLIKKLIFLEKLLLKIKYGLTL